MIATSPKLCAIFSALMQRTQEVFFFVQVPIFQQISSTLINLNFSILLLANDIFKQGTNYLFLKVEFFQSTSQKNVSKVRSLIMLCRCISLKDEIVRTICTCAARNMI